MNYDMCAANLGALPECKSIRAGYSKPAVGSDERLERKEILKMMVSGTAKKVKSALQLKIICFRVEI